jgi:hypothetical protein
MVRLSGGANYFENLLDAKNGPLLCPEKAQTN